MVERAPQAIAERPARAGAIYLSYQAPKAAGAFTLLRPSDWELREIPAEERSWELALLGPIGRAGTYSVGMNVHVWSAGSLSAQGAAEEVLARYRTGLESRVLGRAEGLLAGVPAVEAELAFAMHLPLDSLDPQLTTIRQRHVFLRRGDRLYELTYAAAEEDFSTWFGAFATLVRTFSFPEKPATGAFRPLLAPMAPMADR